MTTLLLVEDDVAIQTSLGLYLGNSGYEVISAYRGDTAVGLYVEKKPDLIILDINLPGKDGITLCREFREIGDTPIIMLSARGAEDDKIETLELGADDYMAKPFSPRELVARIKAVLKRYEQRDASEKNLFEEGKEVRIGDFRIDPAGYQVFISGKEVRFTKTEFLLLYRLAKEVGKIISRETLMKEIMGYDNYLYDRTIDTHVKNVRKKLEGALLLETVRGVGYRLEPVV